MVTNPITKSKTNDVTLLKEKEEVCDFIKRELRHAQSKVVDESDRKSEERQRRTFLV